ncbi:MAG: type VI secretion system contractile sheath large subunit [Fibrobacterota bacterium]|nr:type VI secretion system contractile sheath large subunit [Chitinispirillaceae bacterium]
MAEELKEGGTPAAEHGLDYIYEAMDLTVPQSPVDVMSFADAKTLADSKSNERIGAALSFFLESVIHSGLTIDKIDKNVVDNIVADIDKRISMQLDEIMHHPDFQKMESSWRSLRFLIDKTDFKKNVKIDLFDVSKNDIIEDFEDSAELIQSGLYKQIYTDEYDTPGGEPYGAMISNFDFSAGPEDVGLLQNLSKVAAACHCPFIGSANPKFFGKDDIHDLPKIDDLHTYMDRSEFMRWNSFRQTEDSRYVGLTLPRFALRLPYGPDTIPVKDFNYTENITGKDHEKYLWGNASFAFASNMVRSFVDNGWCVQVRGPESGGKVEDLPVHFFDVGKGTQVKIPTEILIPETREFEFANEGFIPLSFYKNRNYACFFSANSSQKPQEYDDPAVTANMRVNSRLPYILLVSRIAHYLKVIQRENIGTTKSKEVLQDELNKWIKGLVTEMPNPGPDLIATRPLKAAQVQVREIPDNPGFFSVSLAVMPHFQIEGIDINLSLVSQMPKGK